jgi:hypothetical protein
VDVEKLVKDVYIIEILVQISLKQPNIFSKKLSPLCEHMSQKKATKKMIMLRVTLIFKFADINKLNDWQLITLLNVTYKIIVKVLQL